MRLILATLLAVAVLPAAALAAPPTVTTGSADPVGQTTATLKGTVDPNSEQANYFFEYGTTTQYGLKTVERTAGLGDDPVAVQEAISGLTPATTYHFRLVSGTVQGEDKTFTTAAAPLNPAIPGIASLSARDRTATSARLTARVDPNRAATTYHVEWGYSSSFGNRTDDQTLPAGDGGVAVSVALGGLQPYRRVSWRVVATNAAGVKRSGTASFTTSRAPAGVSAVVSTTRAAWGDPVVVSGRVEGAGVNGMTVALEEGTFPYSTFAEVATAKVDSSGRFRFRSRQALIATRFRVVTRSTPSFTTAATLLETLVRPRASAFVQRRRKRTASVAGTVNPAIAGATATLQRRIRGRGWASVRTKAPTAADQFRAHYRFTVTRSRRAARRFRVVVRPPDAAYLTATSRAVTVAKAKRARR